MKKSSWLMRLAGILLFMFFVYLSVQYFDWYILREQSRRLLADPLWLAVMALVYTTAFYLRALAWRLYAGWDRLSLSTALYGVFHSMFWNHLLPVKMGDLIRAFVTVERREMRWETAIHTVVVMRIVDILVLAMLAGFGVLFYSGTILQEVSWVGGAVPVLFILLVTLLIYGMRKKWFHIMQKHLKRVKQRFRGRRGLALLLLSGLSWVLEGIVVFGVARSFAAGLSFWESVWVNSVTVAGQIFHLFPGGIGTYEGIMSLSMASVGVPWQDAYHIALISHGFKFVFAYLVGAIVLVKSPVSWKTLRNAGRMKQAGRRETTR
ncbi:MAG: flippase-like domain-containing protein [Bacillaceae bacterium]|nr:flippase-like domain-containing protein [Bacillaceae bacterium]